MRLRRILPYIWPKKSRPLRPIAVRPDPLLYHRPDFELGICPSFSASSYLSLAGLWMSRSLSFLQTSYPNSSEALPTLLGYVYLATLVSAFFRVAVD